MKIRLKHEKLAEEMAKSPVTLNRWAQRMGLRSGHLSQLANGQRRYPTAKTRQKILDATGLEFEDLFEIETAKPKPSPDGTPASQPKRELRRTFSDAGSPTPRYRGKGRRRESLMSGWWFDCRSAARSLAKRPGYALAATATLALGIGANIALFTAVNAVLFKAYPYQAPERLMVLESTDTETGFGSNLSLPNALDLRERLAGKIDVAAWDWEPFSLSGGDRPQRIGGAFVTSHFDRTVGVPMIRGRFFNDDEAESEGRVVVLTEDLWRGSFGEDPGIVGRTVLLDGEPTTVVGIAPSTLDVIDRAQLFVPLSSSMNEHRNSRWLGGYARISDKLTLDQAGDVLLQASTDLEEQFPIENENRRYSLTDLRENRVGPTRTMFLTLQGVVAVVLLIVCANVANLFLSRGAARGEEMRVRSALGASKGLLARLVVFESAWLCLVGLLAGGIIGLFGSRLLFRLVPRDNIPAWLQIDPDARVAVFAVVATLLTMLVSSFLPALRQAEAGGVLSSGQRVVRGRASRILVIAEVALSCVLLFGAGLLVRSLLELTERDPGFDTDNAVVVGLDLLSLRNSPAEVREQQFPALLRRVLGSRRGLCRWSDRSHPDGRWSESSQGSPSNDRRSKTTTRWSWFRALRLATSTQSGSRVTKAGTSFVKKAASTAPAALWSAGASPTDCGRTEPPSARGSSSADLMTTYPGSRSWESLATCCTTASTAPLSPPSLSLTALLLDGKSHLGRSGSGWQPEPAATTA